MRILLLSLCTTLAVFLPGNVVGQLYAKFNGTSATNFGGPAPNRFQLLYLPADIETPPNNIVKTIYFRKNGISNTITVTNFQIRLGCVSATRFPNNGTQFFTQLTPVFSKATHSISGNQSSFALQVDPVFAYQAGKTLVVEVSYTSSIPNLSVRMSQGPAVPNNKRLNASGSSGSPSTDWLDFGFDPLFEENGIAPPNDLCTSASPLTLNLNCQPISGHTAFATQNLPPAFCGGFTSTNAKDVYYSFTANTPTDSFFVQGLGGFDPVIQVYSGTCGALTSIRCAYTPGDDHLESISPGNLVPGQSYFLRIYGKDGVDGSFTLCGRSGSLLAPSNDDCQNATPLPISTVCTGNTGTIAGATQSIPPIPCNGNTSSAANDVWYSFVAQHPYDSVVVTSNGFLNPVVEFFSGSCGNLNTLSCSDHPTNPLARERVSSGDLLPGTTYYVRIYGFGNTSGTFTICVKTPPINPPANDESCSPIGLVPTVSCTPQQFSNAGATQSKAPINCQPGGLSAGAADVWFSFQFETNFDTVIVSPVGNFNPVVEVFTSFGNCVQITSERCSDGIDPAAVEKVHTMGINNSIVYVRVYGFNGSLGSFNICIKKSDPSVLYDLCANAKPLAVSANCILETGRTTNATPSPGLASCTGNADDDVWYKLDPLGAGNLIFRLRCEPGFDGVMQIFSGTCNGLTPLACINRVGSGSQEDTMLVVPNAVLDYYVRIYHHGPGGGTGGFSFCATLNSAPANNNCNNATLMQNGTNVCAGIGGTLYAANQSNAPATCSARTSAVANDVWYLFVASSATMEIQVRPIGGIDPVLQIFNGGCLVTTPRACIDDSTAGHGETLIVPNLTIGGSYYFRVYSNSKSAAYGDFTVCVKNGNNCTTQPGTVVLSRPVVVNNGRVLLNLSGQTPGATVQWQVSYDGGTQYSNFGPANATLPDTLTLAVPGSQNVWIKALVSLPNCNPSTSQPAALAVRCATTFASPIAAQSGTYVASFSLHTFSNSSTPAWTNGGYESFTNTPVSLCPGSSYPLTITHAPASEALTRVLWMDLNNDGDFADANELVLPPTTGTGTLSQSILIPANTTAEGSIRIRVMAYAAGAGSPAPDPCQAGPYLSGEIEEYSVNISRFVQALAGPDRIVCSPTATLAGSSPSPGSGFWSVVSGPATVVSPGNANSPVINIGSGPSLLVWKITNGACTSSDTVQIQGESITLSLGNDTTLCEGDSLVLNPGGGFSTYLWTNGSTSPTLTVYGPGSVGLQATSPNGCPYSDNILISICTGIGKGISRRQAEVFPNPGSGSFQVRTGNSGLHQWQLFGPAGQQKAQGQLQLQDPEESFQLHFGDVAPGLYWLEIVQGRERFRTPVLIR